MRRLRYDKKEDFDISSFSAINQVILNAMKRYGIILADNGSAWFVSGVPDPNWDNDELRELRSVLGVNFEAVDVSVLLIDPNSGQSRPQNPGPDYNSDGDVDGVDLGEYAKRLQQGTAALDVGQFASVFGSDADTAP